jgi:chondroitin AC lyase
MKHATGITARIGRQCAAALFGALLCIALAGCRKTGTQAQPGGQPPRPAALTALQEEHMFTTILERVRAENSRALKPSLDDAVSAALEHYRAGAFRDIDYQDTSRTEWQPLTHLTRLYDLTLAYTAAQSRYYQSDTLYTAVEAGLEYWLHAAPVCNNWWYNQIAAPQRIGQMLIQMRAGNQQLPRELETALLAHLEATGGSPGEWTGANKTDIALHWLYRAVLSSNTALLAEAAARAWETVTTENPEGIQPDNSYFQHDRQLYIQGYGMEFIKGISLFALYLAETPWALSGDKLTLFSAFVTGTYLPVIRGQYAHFTTGGRGILSRKGASSCAGQVPYLERMRVIDPANSAVYSQAIERISGAQNAGYAIAAAHTHYPIADYTLHTRSAWAFDVRTASARTGRIEWGNNENRKAYYAADGCTTIVRRGDEYRDIFPVWDWTRIPGVTAPRPAEIPLPPKDWCVYGDSTFSGGVSDGLYGVTAYRMEAAYTGVSALKSWFFFDDAVVCLGSGIQSGGQAQGLEVDTTVNQSLLEGPVTIIAGGAVRELSGESEMQAADAPDTVLHDGTAYYFPRGGRVSMSGKTRSGSWQDINGSQSDAPVSAGVFTLAVNHGIDVREGSYAYIVAPGVENIAEARRWQEQSAVEILSNTAEIQAVYHRTLDILSLVFYREGAYQGDRFQVKVDAACVVMFRQASGSKPLIYAADPGQRLEGVSIEARLGEKGRERSASVDFSGGIAGQTKAGKWNN